MSFYEITYANVDPVLDCMRKVITQQKHVVDLSTRPVTSLGHQKWRRVFWEGPNFLIFDLCSPHFPEGGEKFCRGLRPPGYGPVVNY